MKTKEFNKIKPYTYLVTRLSDNKKYHGVRWGNKVPPIKIQEQFTLQAARK